MALVDRARLWINGKLVENMMSIKRPDELSREPFIPAGEERPVGSTVKPGAQFLEIEEKPNTASLVDWRGHQEAGTVLKAVVQEYAGAVKGDRIQYSIQVAEVNDPDVDNEGKASRTIKGIVIGKGKKL